MSKDDVVDSGSSQATHIVSRGILPQEVALNYNYQRFGDGSVEITFSSPTPLWTVSPTEAKILPPYQGSKTVEVTLETDYGAKSAFTFSVDENGIAVE